MNLFEVKAKSYSSKDENFIAKNGGINTKWKEYIYDVAFQKFVVAKAFPQLSVNAYLTLIDKEHSCTVKGLHQCFKIEREIFKQIKNGEEKIIKKKYIKVKDNLIHSDLDTNILKNINVDEIIDRIWKGALKIDYNNASLIGKTFEESLAILSDAYNSDKKMISEIDSRCGKCEYKAKPEEIAAGKKDGVKECLKAAWNVIDKDFEQPSIFELWKGNMGPLAATKTNNWIKDKKYWLNKLIREDYAPNSENNGKKKIMSEKIMSH